MPLVIHNDNIQNTWQKRMVNIRYLKQINIFVLYDISNHAFEIP